MFKCQWCSVQKLTWQLESGQKALEEVFAGVWQGHGPELGHHDTVVLAVGLVTLTGQEAALVGHLAFGYFELVQKSHAVKPVVEPGEMKTNRTRFRLRGSTIFLAAA